MSMTPYAAAKIINAWLQENEIIDPKTDEIKILPPQMIYTYAKKGMIPSEVIDGKIQISEVEFAKWMTKYTSKFQVAGKKNTEVHEDQMVLAI